VFDFVRDLLLKRADYIPDAERDEHLRFVGKFQQVTSPVTAKGVEDTALYIYNRLVSLNEVGGEPDRFGDSLRTPPRVALDPTGTLAARPVGDLHARHQAERGRQRGSTCCRSYQRRWKQAISRWARANRRGRSAVDGQPYPSRNEEYLLYQTLVGSWPLEPMNPDEERTYRDRIAGYMTKAMREAKVHTSWINPSQPHEDAMTRFVHAVLAPDHTVFRNDFVEFQRRVSRYGLLNSLSQVAIKVGAPGVPDFYQGTELWDFSLVDPDNRRPVNYERRRMLLADLDAALREEGAASLAARVLETSDDRLKLYATATMLRFRRSRRPLFEQGGYEPIVVGGARRDHLFAFARILGDDHVIVAVPRLVATLLPDPGVPPLGEAIWGETHLVVPMTGRREYRNVFTDRRVPIRHENGLATVHSADVFDLFPIALLEVD
jgi:(1->4)-alpha-D-glucan 1-alpha-D-glucosylmutase